MAAITTYETAAGRQYRIRYRKPDGSQTDKRGFRRKSDAEQFLAAITVSKSRGEYIDPADSRITIGELGADWISTQTHLKPSTARSVESTWRVQVEPVWGGRGVAEVRHSEIQQWVDEVAQTHSSTTVKRAHGILSAIFQRAIRDRRISSNPAQSMNLPRRNPLQRVYLSGAQVRMLAEQAHPHGTLVSVLAYTGLRWGEATALRVRDIDLERRRLTVAVNAVNVGSTIVVGTPKTHRARSVPYPAFLSSAIAEQCSGKPEDQLVFGDGKTHLPRAHSEHGWFARAVTRCQKLDPTFPRITPHDLRHTTASLAISAGANVKAIQRMLGHASATMTLDTYADLFEDDLETVATKLDQAARADHVDRLGTNPQKKF